MPQERTEPSKDTRSSYFGYASVLAASALFGSAFTLAKLPLSIVDPLLLSAVIYVISGAALVPFAKASFRLATGDYYYLMIITILGAVIAPVLLFYGLKQTAASDASILTNGEVIFTIILSSLFFGEKPKGKIGIFAIILVVAGLLVATTNIKISSSLLELKAGNVMILLAMFCWAIDNNVSRKLLIKSPDSSPAKIAMLKSLIGGIVLLAIAIFLGNGSALAGISYTVWLTITAVAISGFGGALLLFLEGMKRIGTVKTMSMFSMTPIFGIIIAAAVLGEAISILQAIATIAVISGVILLSRN